MRKIGIRYYDTLLTEENFIAMAEGGDVRHGALLCL